MFEMLIIFSSVSRAELILARGLLTFEVFLKVSQLKNNRTPGPEPQFS
jgi:hypothetical protein